MAKKKYRIYKSGGEQGRVMNPTAQFLARAQEGMQQPSPEEMAMMQQQAMQQQGQPQMQQQQGGQDQMMQQLVAAIGQDIQNGAQPEEVVAKLLQDQVEPEMVAEALVELGMPIEEVDQLMASVIQQLEGGQEQGQPSEEEMMAMQQQQMAEQAPPQEQPAPEAPMSKGGYVKKRLKKAQEGMVQNSIKPSNTNLAAEDGVNNLSSLIDYSKENTLKNQFENEYDEMMANQEMPEAGLGREMRQELRQARREDRIAARDERQAMRQQGRANKQMQRAYRQAYGKMASPFGRVPGFSGLSGSPVMGPMMGDIDFEGERGLFGRLKSFKMHIDGMGFPANFSNGMFMNGLYNPYGMPEGQQRITSMIDHPGEIVDKEGIPDPNPNSTPDPDTPDPDIPDTPEITEDPSENPDIEDLNAAIRITENLGKDHGVGRGGRKFGKDPKLPTDDMYHYLITAGILTPVAVLIYRRGKKKGWFKKKVDANGKPIKGSKPTPLTQTDINKLKKEGWWSRNIEYPIKNRNLKIQSKQYYSPHGKKISTPMSKLSGKFLAKPQNVRQYLGQQIAQGSRQVYKPFSPYGKAQRYVRGSKLNPVGAYKRSRAARGLLKSFVPLVVGAELYDIYNQGFQEGGYVDDMDPNYGDPNLYRFTGGGDYDYFDNGGYVGYEDVTDPYMPYMDEGGVPGHTHETILNPDKMITQMYGEGSGREATPADWQAYRRQVTGQTGVTPSGNLDARNVDLEKQAVEEYYGIKRFGGTPIAREGMASSPQACKCPDGSWSLDCCSPDVRDYVEQSMRNYEQSMEAFGDDVSPNEAIRHDGRDSELFRDYLGAHGDNISGLRGMTIDKGYYKGADINMNRGYQHYPEGSKAFMNQLYLQNDPKVMQKLKGFDDTIQSLEEQRKNPADPIRTGNYTPPPISERTEYINHQYGGTPMAEEGFTVTGNPDDYPDLNEDYMSSIEDRFGKASRDDLMSTLTPEQQEMYDAILARQKQSQQRGYRGYRGYGQYPYRRGVFNSMMGIQAPAAIRRSGQWLSPWAGPTYSDGTPVIGGIPTDAKLSNIEYNRRGIFERMFPGKDEEGNRLARGPRKSIKYTFNASGSDADSVDSGADDADTIAKAKQKYKEKKKKDRQDSRKTRQDSRNTKQDTRQSDRKTRQGMSREERKGWTQTGDDTWIDDKGRLRSVPSEEVPVITDYQVDPNMPVQHIQPYLPVADSRGNTDYSVDRLPYSPAIGPSEAPVINQAPVRQRAVINTGTNDVNSVIAPEPPGYIGTVDQPNYVWDYAEGGDIDRRGNREFAREQISGEDRLSRRDRRHLRRDLNRGEITQDQYVEDLNKDFPSYQNINDDTYVEEQPIYESEESPELLIDVSEEQLAENQAILDAQVKKSKSTREWDNKYTDSTSGSYIPESLRKKYPNYTYDQAQETFNHDILDFNHKWKDSKLDPKSDNWSSDVANLNYYPRQKWINEWWTKGRSLIDANPKLSKREKENQRMKLQALHTKYLNQLDKDWDKMNSQMEYGGYQEGDEVYMNPDEIAQYMAAGGQVEFL